MNPFVLLRPAYLPRERCNNAVHNYRASLAEKLRRILFALYQGDLEIVDEEQLDESFLDGFLAEVAEDDREHPKEESVRTGLLQLSEQLSDEDLAMECQLQLLRSYAALSRRNENEFLQAIAEALTAATLFVQSPTALNRAFDAALAIWPDDDFELGRLCLRRATGLLEQGDYRAARKWANRIPQEQMGPYKPYVESLEKRLGVSPCRRCVAWLRGLFHYFH